MGGEIMILNVSGRTDIVAYYTPWFLNRIKAGFFDVRNPFFPKQVSRIFYRDVDAFILQSLLIKKKSNHTFLQREK